MLDTSPQVHPTGVEHGFNNGVAGMTLLQYYAGQVLPALILSSSKYCSNESGSFNFVVIEALDYADDLVSQYNKRYGGQK
jgi:hypothetical protein